MRLHIAFTVLALAMFVLCCIPESEATFGKLKLLRLLKAGIIIKALRPKKILLPLPLILPILHSGKSFGGGSDSFGDGGGGHGSYHHGGGGGGYGGGGHNHFGYQSGGWYVEGPHHFHHGW